MNNATSATPDARHSGRHRYAAQQLDRRAARAANADQSEAQELRSKAAKHMRAASGQELMTELCRDCRLSNCYKK